MVTVRCVLLVVVVGSGLVVHGQSQAISPDASQRRAAEIAEQRGLRAAAEVAGAFVGSNSFARGGIAVPGNLDAILAPSELVLSGVVVSERACLSRDEMSISTEYEVKPSDVYRETAGAQFVHSPIVVLVSGGRVTFPNGTSAEIQTPGSQDRWSAAITCSRCGRRADAAPQRHRCEPDQSHPA